MKKITIHLFMLLALLFACKNNTTQSINSDSTTIAKDTVETIKYVFFERIKLKVLPALVNKQQKDLETLFNEYLKAINQQIYTQKQIENIFILRDSLRMGLSGLIEKNFFEVIEENYEKQDVIDKELKKLGYTTLYAEGMVFGLGYSSIVENEIEKNSPEDFKLYSKFLVEYWSNVSGEYPFMNVSGYGKAIEIGEKMYRQYSNSQYFQKIKDDYFRCLSYVTDIHKAIIQSEDYTQNNCFYSDITYEYYPYSTDCNVWETLLKDFPQSQFAPIFKKLMKNTSEISVSNNEDDMPNVFLVYTNIFEDFSDADSKIMEYIHKGIDIVHKVKVFKNQKDYYYVCYRFYSEKDRAINAQKEISKNGISTKIAEVTTTGEFVEDL